MNDPTLDAARARIRETIADILEDAGIPMHGAAVGDLTLDDRGILELEVDPTALDEATVSRLVNQVRGLGLSIDPIEHVRVTTTMADAEAQIRPDGVGSLVAVAGAKGGVGRTTLTAALATMLRDRGYRVGIFDCDVSTADIVRLFDIDEPIRSTPDGRPAPVSIDGIEVVSVELVAGDRPVVWRGAMVHDVLTDLLGRAQWTDRDIVLLDLPPGVGDAVYTTVQKVALDGAIVVGTPSPLADAGRERARSLLSANDVSVLASVTTMTGPGGPFDADAESAAVAVPYDRALQSPDGWPGTLEAETRAALDGLATTVESTIDTGGDPFAETVDLRGLPTDVAVQQAELEVADAPDGPRELAVDGAAVQTHLEACFGDDAVEAVTDSEAGRVVRPTANAHRRDDARAG